MTDEVGAHTNRPKLVAAHGYDTKFTMHALRLGLQGVEFLTTGRISEPVPEPDPTYLRSVRRGEVPLAEATDAVDTARARLLELAGHPSLPDQPDRAWVDARLHQAHASYGDRGTT